MVPEIVRLGLVAFGPEVRQLHGGGVWQKLGAREQTETEKGVARTPI